MKKMRKRVLVALSMLFVAGAMTACGSGNGGSTDTSNVDTNNDQQISEASAKDTLEVVLPTFPISMDPIGSNDSASALINKQIYDTLFDQDYDTMEVYSALATSWEQVDAQTINIELREDVYFHNGTPLTARDVQASLERASNSPAMEQVVGMIDHVEVHDDRNLTIHLEIPFMPMLRHLAHPGSSIVPADLIESAHDLNAQPIGTGPFEFVSLDIDTRIVLERNDSYWGDPVQVSDVIIRRVADASIRLLEVQTGHADIALDPVQNDIATVEADPNLVLMRRPDLRTNYIGFNMEKYPFDNPLVRQAINYAVDSQLIFDTVFFGSGEAGRGFMSPLTWGFAEDMEMFPYDVEKARELMIEAGFPDGFSTEIWWNTETPQRGDQAEIVQNMLRNINIDVSVVGMDWATYLSRTERGEHEMFVLGWTVLGGDADYGLFPLFHSSMHGAPGNRTFLADPEIDRLLAEARSEADEETRRQLYIEAQELIRDQAPWIPINHGEALAIVSPSLRGFILSPANHHEFRRAYFAE